ncbi:MAG TPA: cell division protein FtsZ, partial [Verrucomicrobiales bacterium]|nr:cell division protein FtsZ [Verrucomicrobiales bacterium]
GGGTGSGAAPMVTRLARETGAFVIVFATMPFVFEGKRRMQQAHAALEEIRRHANALVCFENDKMGELVLPKKGVTEAFEVADKIICQSVRAVTTVATQPGLIRIGMDDLVTALRNADSRCLFGFGQAKGEARATDALQMALKSPLLDRGQLLEKARNVLVHICGGASLTLFEIETLMRELTKHVSDDAQILFGAACDNKLADSLSVTIISSIGKAKTVEPVAEERITAPVKPVVPVAPVAPAVTQHTGSVPILSVQPRQAPPAPVSNTVAPAAFTMTGATSNVPVLKLSAAFAPQVKPAPKPVKTMPLAPPPAEPDLFASPEPVPAPAVAPVREEKEPEIVPVAAVVAPPVEEPVVAIAEPEVEVFEEIVAEEPPVEVIAEEEEIEIEEEIVAEIPVAEEEEPLAEEEPVMEEPVEEEIVAEEEIELEDEVEEVPEVQHPAFAAERVRRPSAPMRPIEIQQPVPKSPVSPARKFDLREILQRQRQTRLGQLSRPSSAPAEPVAERLERPVPPPARPVPVRPSPAADRIPNPARVSPIRPIPAAQPTQPAPRAVSPFTPARPQPSAAPAPAPVAAAPRGTQQVTFDERLATAARGSRFEKTEPTYDEEGGDLDVPTFLRKKR